MHLFIFLLLALLATVFVFAVVSYVPVSTNAASLSAFAVEDYLPERFNLGGSSVRVARLDD